MPGSPGSSRREFDGATFDRLFAANVRAPYFLVGVLAPKRAALGSGRFTNVGNLASQSAGEWRRLQPPQGHTLRAREVFGQEKRKPGNRPNRGGHSSRIPR